MLLLRVLGLLAATFLFIWGSYAQSNELYVCAFNLRVFGISRMTDESAVAVYSNIIRRYDVILLQEIRDASQTAIVELLDRVNADGADEYSMSLSNRTGRTSSKEQYAFFFKTSKLEVLAGYDYDDSAKDIFEREPWVAHFRSVETDAEFFMVALHSKPDDLGNLTVVELAELTNVYADAVTHFGGLESAILLGDFNADCDYVEADNWPNIPLCGAYSNNFCISDTYSWLIPQFNASGLSMWDTTVSATDCAYDRIVVTNDLLHFVVEDSALVFYFDAEYGLNSTLTATVSDHYPVEFKLQWPASEDGKGDGKNDERMNTVAAVFVSIALCCTLCCVGLVVLVACGALLAALASGSGLTGYLKLVDRAA